MTQPEYKNLNLKPEIIEPTVFEFAGKRGYTIQSIADCPGSQVGTRIVFGVAGQPFATVNVYLNVHGGSTIQYRTGLNHGLGLELAQCLFETIAEDELQQVNMVIDGFVKDTIIPVLECVAEEEHIELETLENSDSRAIWKLTSVYKDSLTVTLHVGSNKLQIQGRPLTCYSALIFNLTALLDLNGLEKVLVRKEDGQAEIIQQEVARSYLKKAVGTAYEHLPLAVEKLLVSGLCVKLAAPALPDYSFLLYPELRSIEGILKERLAEEGLKVGANGNGFGDIFGRDHRTGRFVVHQEHHADLASAGYRRKLEDAYTFYHKERHSFFHMSEVANASRMLGNLQHLMAKSDEAWAHITNIYSN